MFSVQGAMPDFSFPILQKPTADDLWLAYLSDDILAGEITADDALTLMCETAPTATRFPPDAPGYWARLARN